jgi:hypothetical protein
MVYNVRIIYAYVNKEVNKSGGGKNVPKDTYSIEVNVLWNYNNKE